jgi:CubicO group peptidase (beta-lactamase class C family)
MVRLLLLAASISIASLSASAGISDYQGTYEYEPHHNVEIVAGDELFAVLDEAKYVLKPMAGDDFATVGGQTLSFRRSPSGQVTGYVDSGKLHLRLSPDVTREAAALARPRPAGEDDPDSYRYSPPPDLKDGIPVGDIAQTALGHSTADRIVHGILAGTWKDVHSVLLYQDGKLVLEEYFYGYTRERTHQLRSATKSIVSALAGIAIDTGALRSVNEPVMPHLTYGSYANPDPRKSAVSVGNFLAMSSGLACNDHDSSSPGREMVIDEQPDWVKATMDLPMVHDPGTVGAYCSGGVAVVGRVVENAVHKYLPDFAQANLFGPLGVKRGDWFWNYALTNANKEYSQIHLRPRDMLKVGMLYANEGKWQGHQIVSASWVKASLAKQSTVDETEYGYFWWHPWLEVQTSSGPRQVFFSAAQGNGGQKIYIVPQFHLVAVFTAGAYNAGGSSPNKIMTGVVFPVLIGAQGSSQTSSSTSGSK